MRALCSGLGAVPLHSCAAEFAANAALLTRTNAIVTVAIIFFFIFLFLLNGLIYAIYLLCRISYLKPVEIL